MKIGFIGCGNMGGALAKAVAQTVPARDITVTEKDHDKAADFALETGVALGTLAETAGDCQFLFLAVKPQVFPQVMAELSPILAKRETPCVLVSMAAGITAATVQALVGASYPVIRIMPNLPVSVGEGMILYTATPEVNASELETFLSIMKAAGRLTRLSEPLFDAGTAVSGCGPAYVCLFLEALADGGVRCGLPREEAILLAEQALYGTAKLLLSRGTHPAALKDAVCSPGGSTIAGVQALEENAFRHAVIAAVTAADARNRELGKKTT
ncbi:MAG: pyrroline-5-carboxylate reductase [Ruminococcaceae bacterium]|nr:pyrroline-5-carboxylate reductase [Oscillospiraceae bacterium]